jgi:hypothetical protein
MEEVEWCEGIDGSGLEQLRNVRTACDVYLGEDYV